jgi:hypothetical protein
MGKKWKFPFYNLHTSYLTPVSRVTAPAMGGTGFFMLLILGKTQNQELHVSKLSTSARKYFQIYDIIPRTWLSTFHSSIRARYSNYIGDMSV